MKLKRHYQNLKSINPIHRRSLILKEKIKVKTTSSNLVTTNRMLRMMADKYIKAEAQLDFRDISEHIEEENLEGAASQL